MKCNYCWKDIEGACVITICSHVFCIDDAESCFSKEMVCPACDKSLTRRDVRQVDTDSPVEEKIMSLCGFHPDIVFEAAHKAIMFFENQKNIEIKYFQFLNKEVQSKFEESERSCEEKIHELSNRNSILMKRVQTMDGQCDSIKSDLIELQEKYSEKVREKTKIQELYNSLKRKYDQVCRENVSTRIVTPDPFSNDCVKKSQGSSYFQLNEDCKTLSPKYGSSKPQSHYSKVPDQMKAMNPFGGVTKSSMLFGPSQGKQQKYHNTLGVAPKRPMFGRGFNKKEAQQLLFTPVKRSRLQETNSV